MRAAPVFVLAACLATPAVAALAPEWYEKARRDAPHVVVLEVERVNGLGPTQDHGTCTVIGKVRAVERGGHYRVGGPVEVAVPCAKPRAQVPAGPAQWQGYAALKDSRAGRAWMTRPGELALFQYQILAP